MVPGVGLTGLITALQLRRSEANQAAAELRFVGAGTPGQTTARFEECVPTTRRNFRGTARYTARDSPARAA